MPKLKPKRAGRPKLPQGNAKGVMLRVRITQQERDAIESRAKANNQSVSEWLRSKIAAEMGA
jgi:hypothetical protein